MEKEKKYTVTLTESQLRIIANCVEDCHRFMAGQCELWNMASMLDNYCELQDKLKELKPLITPYISDYRASYGWSGGDCPNEYQRKFIAQTYPIYREIYHFFSDKGNHSDVYSSATLTCEEGGSPIKIKECSE